MRPEPIPFYALQTNCLGSESRMVRPPTVIRQSMRMRHWTWLRSQCGLRRLLKAQSLYPGSLENNSSGPYRYAAKEDAFIQAGEYIFERVSTLLAVRSR